MEAPLRAAVDGQLLRLGARYRDRPERLHGVPQLLAAVAHGVVGRQAGLILSLTDGARRAGRIERRPPSFHQRDVGASEGFVDDHLRPERRMLRSDNLDYFDREDDTPPA